MESGSGPLDSVTYLLLCYRDRLSASDMLQVRKVMEHVYEKIINLDNESQTTSSSANDKPGEQEKEEDMAMLAEEKIELMCQDQKLSLFSTQCTRLSRTATVKLHLVSG
ncbi:WD repeat-containing protein 48 [Goodea atripinnis]|uniref:WD repeat-containing protein 48 n=1 Tax=Goodea atripinnis TaxID=208336 RepID=A0ABV0N7U1_9TELE